MNREHLELFRNIIKNRPQEIKGKVLGFGFSMSIFPNWSNVFEKQLQFAKLHRIPITEENLTPNFYNARLTGSRDYLFEGDGGNGEGDCYGETECLLTNESRHPTNDKLYKFFGNDIIFSFGFKNTTWYDEWYLEWFKSNSKNELVKKALLSFNSGGYPFVFNNLGLNRYISAACDPRGADFNLRNILAYFNEIRILKAPIERLPSYFGITHENKYAPPGERGMTIPVAPDWLFKTDQFGSNEFELFNSFCRIDIRIFPKIMRQLEWPEEC